MPVTGCGGSWWSGARRSWVKRLRGWRRWRVRCCGAFRVRRAAICCLLRDFIVAQRSFFNAFVGRSLPRVAVWLIDEPEMARSGFAVPAIPTLGELATRLGLSASELD